MKKLLKNVICGSVNSTRKYYSQKTWSTTAAWKKKKKENAERKNVDAHMRNPKTYYVNSWKLKVSLTLPSFLAFFTTSKAPLTIVSTQRPY